MAQSLEVNIKTTSDVPQAMEKSKSATVSFSKQVEDIQKKFSTAFKDIFLGFTAPMVLLQHAISFISDSIAQAKQDAKEGLELLAQGQTAFASTDEQKAASFFKRRAEIKEEQRLVEEGRREVTKQILTSSEFKDFTVPEDIKRRLAAGESISSVSKDKALQQKAMEYYKNSEEGKKVQESMVFGVQDNKPTTFKAPEGFGNVIGVGANPVLEAMTAQLEEAKLQTDLLRSLNDKYSGGGVPADFTKATADSRGTPYNK